MRAPLGGLTAFFVLFAACGTSSSSGQGTGGQATSSVGGSVAAGGGAGQGAAGGGTGQGAKGNGGQGATGGGLDAAGNRAAGGAPGATDASAVSVDGQDAARAPLDATTDALAGGRFPFPQNQRLARCTYPAAANSADALGAYTRWKAELVTANGAGGHLRVRRPNSPGSEVDSTVSEGIAYGMLLAVAMDDPALLDELWKYSQLWINGNGLMDWYINAAGSTRLGTGGASDADQDIAYALVMASRKWGGSGTIGVLYLDAAKRQIDAIWQHEVDHGNAELLLPGDTWAGNVIFNPSYFAPNEYRVFAVVSGNDGWNRAIDTGYAVLARSINATNGNLSTGLPPAWCGADGVVKVPFAGGATNYQYDAARVPFRIGQDDCFNGEPRAATFLAPLTAFFAGIGAGAIVDGYDLGGAPHPDPDTPAGSPQSAVFVGGAAVGAMHDAKLAAFMNDAYARVATGQLLARSRYYNLSWTALILLMQTGNLVEYPP
jgi:hypothetical protein